jgi:hypothetical protein
MAFRASLHAESELRSSSDELSLAEAESDGESDELSEGLAELAEAEADEAAEGLTLTLSPQPATISANAPERASAATQR